MVDVVFDTVIFVRSLINPRGMWGELVFRQRDRYRLVVSELVISEILEVIERPEIAKKFRFVEDSGVATILELLGAAARVDPVEMDWSGRDPNDDIFIATAIAAGAQYIVSEDRNLLDIVQYSGIEIVDAKAFLRVLRTE